MTNDKAPGKSLFHPAFAVSLLVLIANDHWLKHAHPGWWSGKLSDFAALLILPLFLHALFEVSALRLCGRAASDKTSNRVLLASLGVTFVVYALPEVWEPAERSYRFGVGALQWPLQALAALIGGGHLPPLRPVRATADISDLLALPMLLVAWRLGRRGADTRPRQRQADRRARKLVAPACAVLALALPGAARAAGPAPENPGAHTHDGFFLQFQLGGGALFVDSTDSVSNGFEQSIASSAQGTSFPAGALEIGGTVPDTGLVLGGRVGHALSREPVIDTLGERFTIRDFELVLFELEVVAKYYPDPRAGLHFGAGFGLASLKREDTAGEQQTGPCGALEVGYSLWLARQTSVGLAARLFYSHMSGQEHGRSSAFMPGAFATFTWH